MSELFTWLFYMAAIIGSFVILLIVLAAIDMLWHKIKGEYYR